MPPSCPSCRASVAPTDAFCPTCGQILDTSSSSNHQQQTRPYQPAPRSRAAHQRGARQPAPQRQRLGTRPQAHRPAPPPRSTRAWYQKKRFRLPVVFLALVLIFGGIAAVLINSQLSSFNQISRPSSDSVPGQALAMVEQGRGDELGVLNPVDSGGTTILMMGVDAREGETVDIGVRPDSLSVLHVSDNGTCRTLSIPRDTRAPLPGYGQSKVNHALSVGGIEYQELVVEQLLGIEIDHFALIDFAGMAEIIDAIGGVTVSTDHELSYEGVTVPAGTSTLSGEQALVFARFRSDAEGDFGRQRRQQELLRAILQQTSATDAVRAIPSAMTDLEGHLKTDLKVGGLLSLTADFMLNCDSGAMENAQLEGAVGSDWDDLEGMNLSFVRVPEAEIASKVSWLTNGATAQQLQSMAVLPNERRRMSA